MNPAVGVHGLGKLGAVMAAVIADAGCDVVGVDLDDYVIERLAARHAPVDEPGLQDLLDRIPDGRITVTDRAEWAVQNTDISLVVVPTPSTETGAFDATYVREAVEAIGAGLRTMPDDWWHTVVVCSTLSPGTMDTVSVPALEAASGRQVGATVGLAYSPLFIALGSVIHDIKHPDFVLVGAADGHSQRDMFRLAGIYQPATPVVTMTFVEAELTKLAINGYLSVKIGYANMMARLCDRLGADPRRVLDTIGDDRRIGRAYLRAGGNPGGPCLPRDLDAMEALNMRVPFISAAQTMARIVTQDLSSPLLTHERVAILGFAYKPGTPVSERSMAVDVIDSLDRLSIKPVEIAVHDPEAMVDPTRVKPTHRATVYQATSVEAALHEATAVLIACPHPEYAGLDFGDRVVVDPWRVTS